MTNGGMFTTENKHLPPLPASDFVKGDALIVSQQECSCRGFGKAFVAQQLIIMESH